MSETWPDGSRRVPVSRCPHCGHRLDAASVVQGNTPPPSPGDLSVCIGCGEILAFDHALRLQKIAARELAALLPEEAAELRRTQAAVRAFLEGHGRR